MEGRPGGGGSRTPTHMAENDCLLALIVLRYGCWGKTFFKKNFTPDIQVPVAAMGLEVGEGEGQIF